MKSLTWTAPAVVALVWSCLALADAPPTHTQLWMTATISGAVSGPVANVPGTRFTFLDSEWMVLAAPPGHILFSNARTGRHSGPYRLQPQRIVMLDDKAVLFSKIEPVPPVRPAHAEPFSPHPSVTHEDPPAPRPEAPQGWERQPLPSTNPGEHLNRPAPFNLETRDLPPSIDLWFEPFRNIKYDWSIGGHTGNSGRSLESSRIGLNGTWRSLFVQAALIQNGKIKGSIVPDGLALSNLDIHDGTGFSLQGGYAYSFVIDGNWHATVGAGVQWDAIQFDLDATVMTRTPNPEPADPSHTEDPGAHYGFAVQSGSLRMRDLTLGLFGGIGYSTETWGLDSALIVRAWSDIQIRGSVDVMDDRQSPAADPTHPVGIAFSGWISPLPSFHTALSLTVGTELSLRIGVGKRF